MRLQDMRRSRGLTQREVATACGVNQSAVSSWESGSKTPSAKRLCKLAELLDCTVDEILQTEDKQ